MTVEQPQSNGGENFVAKPKSYVASELVQTEGPNRGNIADKDLARIGAEAENKYRDSLGGKLRGLSDKVMNDGISTKEIFADQAGASAMITEVDNRALESSEASQMSPDGRAKFSTKAGNSFDYLQQDETLGRIEEETGVRPATSDFYDSHRNKPRGLF